MKKRFLPLFLCVLMPFSLVFAACGNEAGNSSSQEASDISNQESESISNDTSNEASNDTSTEESNGLQGDESQSDESQSDESQNDETVENKPIARPEGYPTLCGGFMQPNAFKGYTEKQMIKHLQDMYDVGIDTLILQWSFTTEGGKVTDAYFESAFNGNEYAAGFDESGKGLVNTILSAAEKVGVKVFIGLNDSAEWWQMGVLDRAWIENQSELGLKGAKQLYDEYKEKYPNAFHGWYFVFEFYNMQANKAITDNAAYLLNLYRNGLYGIDGEMPMMLSPYISSAGANPEQTGILWKTVFAATDFRAGDIFCCQDSVGAGHITMDQLEPYYAEIKKAVDSKAGLLFWANNEDFTQSTWSTAPLDRFIEQLKITDKYVSAHITFAYSHYQHPDMGKTGHHLAYKEYYNSGKLPKTNISVPKLESVSGTNEGGNNSVALNITIENPDKNIMGIRVYKDGEQVHFADFTNDYGKNSYTFLFKDSNMSGDGSAEYRVCGVDYYNNEGAAATFTAKYESKDGKNVALGKSYKLTPAPESNYPDEDGKALTDGKLGKAAYFDSAWVGFLSKPEIVIDLAGKNDVYAVSVDTLGGGEASVYHPNAITVSVSDDGINFTVLKTESFGADQGVNTLNTLKHTVALDNSVSCRYVKIAVSTNQSWIFIDEIEVFAE